MKRDHEEWVASRLKSEAPSVTFVELEAVLNYIISGQAADTNSFDLVAPAPKIRRNSLSSKVEGLIKTGLSRSKEVERYVDNHPDVQFGPNLSARFFDEYRRQKSEGLSGDALFMSLWDYAAGPNVHHLRRIAGLVVLVYLFEACEVFEK